MNGTHPEGRFFSNSGYLPAMTTYAQNFEDVTLRRALQDIEKGFYVDIGACHPTHLSVTRWFYDQGWRGINVEPNPLFLDMLNRERPRDCNVGCAVHSGTQTPTVLHVVADTGLSTIDRALVEYAHLPVTKEIVVETMSLDQLLEAHEPLPTIDFLKIDAEGSEVEIIKAASFTRYRPRIILVETNGLELYAPILESRAYRFVWFDGLNSFHVREEDIWRSDLIARPTSTWDSAAPFAIHTPSAELAELKSRRRRAWSAVRRLIAAIFPSVALTLSELPIERQWPLMRRSKFRTASRIVLR
jgi:FkbM family methyltransferase